MPGVIQKRLTALALLALLAGCGTSAPPQTPVAPPPPDPSIAYLAQDFTCKRADAAAVDLTTLQKHAADYDEKCVHLKVFTDAAFLYDDAGHKSTAPIGAFWKNAETARHLKLGPSFVAVTGRVRNCAARHKIAPGSLCRGDAALFVSEAQIIPTAMD
ncbi:MAG TPA: hypothetical protein VGG48_18035 [Rhizomicrobium sp.]|jgi:hypothetical protein